MTDTTATNHNHITRDIKPQGVCPGCDLYWNHEETRQEVVDSSRSAGKD